MKKKTKTYYHLAVLCVDGTEIITFTDEADLTNFIWDIQDHVISMALSCEECKGRN